MTAREATNSASRGQKFQVIVGMSAREVSERDRLEKAAAAIGGTVAFLQMGDPSLSRELTRLADEGAETVVLVGASLGTMAPANSWLRRIAAHWWREREGQGRRPVIEVTTAMIRSDLDLDLVLDVRRAITGTEAGLESAVWEEIPRHRHQVFVCRGPRCSAQGADATAETLARTLRDRGLGDDDVLVTQTGCQFPCNHAPVVTVQPDDIWYGDVRAEDVARLVDEHLVSGRPVESHRLARHPTPPGSA